MKRLRPWLTAISLAIVVVWLQATFFYSYGIDSSWAGWPFEVVSEGSGPPFVNANALLVDIGFLSALAFMVCWATNKAGNKLRWLAWTLWRGGVAIRFFAALLAAYFIIGFTLGRRVSAGGSLFGGDASSMATFEVAQRSFGVRASLYPNRAFTVPGVFSYVGNGSLGVSLSMKADMAATKVIIYSCRFQADLSKGTTNAVVIEYNLPNGPTRIGGDYMSPSPFSGNPTMNTWWSFHGDGSGLRADYLNGRSKMDVVLDMVVAAGSTTQRYSDVVSLNVETPSARCEPYWRVRWDWPAL